MCEDHTRTYLLAHTHSHIPTRTYPLAQMYYVLNPKGLQVQDRGFKTGDGSVSYFQDTEPPPVLDF